MNLKDFQQFEQWFEELDRIGNLWALAYQLHSCSLVGIEHIEDNSTSIIVSMDGVEPWQYGEPFGYTFDIPLECFAPDYDWDALEVQVKKECLEKEQKEAERRSKEIRDEELKELARLKAKHE